MRVIERLGDLAPVPVFVAYGKGGTELIERLHLSREITLVQTTRHASILLVVGEIRHDDQEALKRLHDQLPHPRATVWWGAMPTDEGNAPVCISLDEDPVPKLTATDRALRGGARPSDKGWLPDEPPNPWRGRNENGQGGEGMMGGTPYGRPMAMTAEDRRDGLMLDAMTVSLGPFLPLFPPGLALELTLQGDVIQQARVTAAPFADGDAAACGATLRLAARMLDLLGLYGLAVKCRLSALNPRGNAAGLERAARRSGAFLALPRGLGCFGETDARDRLTAALNGRAPDFSDEDGPRLIDLLPGLEWQEAFIVINSFDAETLCRIAPVTLPMDEKAGQNGRHEDHA